MKMKPIRSQGEKLSGKVVILRTDFNVSIKKGKIAEDYRLSASIPTIRLLARYGAKIVIISHLGRPKAGLKNWKKNEEDYSLKPVAKSLSKMMNKKINFLSNFFDEKTKLAISQMKNGEIAILENIRFYEGEESDDMNFAKSLAELGDIYVNDAFSVSHRAHASVDKIKKYLPSFSGLLLDEEVRNLNRALKPKKPLVLIMGGAKTETKIPLIKNFLGKAEAVLLGGAVANSFLSAIGFEIGRSFGGGHDVEVAKKIKSKKIILPLDLIVSDKKDGTGKINLRKINEVRKTEYILDIGPETIKLYSSIIKKAKTIVWNGPVGMFELPHFKHGTLAMAFVIGSRARGEAFGVAGGGETVEAIKDSGMWGAMDWVSTGGGASLAYLGKEKMPGLK